MLEEGMDESEKREVEGSRGNSEKVILSVVSGEEIIFDVVVCSLVNSLTGVLFSLFLSVVSRFSFGSVVFDASVVESIACFGIEEG